MTYDHYFYQEEIGPEIPPMSSLIPSPSGTTAPFLSNWHSRTHSASCQYSVPKLGAQYDDRPCECKPREEADRKANHQIKTQSDLRHPIEPSVERVNQEADPQVVGEEISFHRIVPQQDQADNALDRREDPEVKFDPELSLEPQNVQTHCQPFLRLQHKVNTISSKCHCNATISVERQKSSAI